MVTNPLGVFECELGQMQRCVVCEDPVDDADRERRHCPHCNAKLSPFAWPGCRNYSNPFNSISIDEEAIRREQANQLREEERDLDYVPGTEGEGGRDGTDSTVGTVGTSTTHGSGCCRGKAKAKNDKPGFGKRTGKFSAYTIKKRKLEPIKQGGKIRYQVCGMEPVRVAMNDQRMQKIHTLMTKNNNFATEDDLNHPDAIVNHFECLQILDQANTNNSHGKGSRYPRYLRDYVGPGKFFLHHRNITRCKQREAHEFIEGWIRTEKIKTQNINGKPALQAKPRELAAKIRKLVSDHKHGIDDYLDALDKLRSGEIKFPEPKSSLPCESPYPSAVSGVVHSVCLGSRVLADPVSPSAMIPGNEQLIRTRHTIAHLSCTFLYKLTLCAFSVCSLWNHVGLYWERGWTATGRLTRPTRPTRPTRLRARGMSMPRRTATKGSRNRQSLPRATFGPIA